MNWHILYEPDLPESKWHLIMMLSEILVTLSSTDIKVRQISSLLRDVAEPLLRHGMRESRSSGMVVIGREALLRAALLRPRVLVFVPKGHISQADIRLVRAVMESRQKMLVVVDSGVARAEAVRRGIAPEHCLLIRPGVSFGQLKGLSRKAVRKSLGIAESERVLFCPGDAMVLGKGSSGHEAAVWAVAIFSEVEPGARLLISGRGKHVGRIKRFAQRLPMADVVCDATESDQNGFSCGSLCASCDLVILPASAPVDPWPVMVAMASGKPVVCNATADLCELLEDRHTAMMVTKPTPKQLIRRLMDVTGDWEAAKAAADRARAECYEMFSYSKWRENWMNVLKQCVAGGTVSANAYTPTADSIS